MRVPTKKKGKIKQNEQKKATLKETMFYNLFGLT